jgi:transcriptional regulator GlxA family with amidase domain
LVVSVGSASPLTQTRALKTRILNSGFIQARHLRRAFIRNFRAIVSEYKQVVEI